MFSVGVRPPTASWYVLAGFMDAWARDFHWQRGTTVASAGLRPCLNHFAKCNL